MTARMLIDEWRGKARESREEAGRIRRTVHDVTDAEVRCNVRAEVWDKCADELSEVISMNDYYGRALEAGQDEVNVFVPVTVRKSPYGGPEVGLARDRAPSDEEIGMFAHQLHRIHCAQHLVDPTDWDRSSAIYKQHFTTLARILLTTEPPRA